MTTTVSYHSRNMALEAMLMDALPRFSSIVHGYALLADETGRVLRLIDHQGRDCPEYIDTLLPEFVAAEETPERIPCPADATLTLQVVTLEGYHICLGCGCGTVRLRETFQEALPMIAKVAGGEAVLFDKDGIRLHSVDSTGNTSVAFVGEASVLAQQSMRENKALMGDSTYIVGAKAVRIPVCEDFGIGFNNNDSVAQRQKLFDNICRLNNAPLAFSDIIGRAPAIRRMKEEAMRAASLDCTLLLIGERGTGKRMLAQAIHNGGVRRSGHFVIVNCDALEQDLLEGAIFGYADAMIRGVRRGRHPGALALANGGTLYLSNIDKMNQEVQTRLLSAMETGLFQQVGSSESMRMNARIIASTRGALQATVKVGVFDEELYRHLARRSIVLPALSEMPEIIPDLAETFIRQLNNQYGTRVAGMDDSATSILMRQMWKGNVGELRAFLETVISTIGQAGLITKRNLPLGLLGKAVTDGSDSEKKTVFDQLVEEYEARVIRHALLVHDGSRLKTARHLGLSKSSLWRKMKKLGIE